MTGIYYAMPFAAAFLGDSGETRVAPLGYGDANEGRVVAYAVYEFGKLTRTASLNLYLRTPEEWNRSAKSVTVRQIPHDAVQETLHYFSAPTGVLQKHRITWKCLQSTFKRGSRDERVKNDTDQLSISNGMHDFLLSDTSGVIVEVV